MRIKDIGRFLLSVRLIATGMDIIMAVIAPASGILLLIRR